MTAASNPDLVRKLNSLYNDYMSIDDDRSLRRSGMTMAEWNALPDVFTKLQKSGSTKTLMSGLANYFRKFGFNVSDDGYGQFVITASTRIRKHSIKAWYQSFGNSGNPFADIEAMKDSFIKQWWRDYDGDPETSWDNIFENALADFEAYANDEASGFLMEQYENGEIGDGDMRNEFDQFTMWKDMNEYDY